jgi:type I restriction enzyme M protein
MGSRNREILERIEKLCLDRTAEESGAAGPRQDILGLIFLRFVCASAGESRPKAALPPAAASAAFSAGAGPAEGGGAGPEKAPEGNPENETPEARRGVFFAPETWDRLFPGPENPAGPPAGQALAAAIRAVERENPALNDLFPGVLKRGAGPRPSAKAPGQESPFILELGRLLGGLSAPEAAQAFITILGESEAALKALRGRSPSPGSAPVPRRIAALLALMLEPCQGRFYDPCCGSAGILAAAVDFARSRQGKFQELCFYAQERSAESWRLARMNLMVRGIDSSEILLNTEGPLQRDPRRDIKFDFIAASPPPGDPFPWIRYTLDRLSAGGRGALILPRSSLVSPRADEREIRRSLVEGRILDCVVNLPAHIFNFPGPCIWFFSRAKLSRGRRSDEVLFIDARSLGRPLNRRQWEFSAADINRIARTYHNWRFPKAAPYRDIHSFALSAHISQIRAAAYRLDPALYLGIPEEEETGQGGQFEALRTEFEALVREESRVNRQILEALRKIRGGDLG